MALRNRRGEPIGFVKILRDHAAGKELQEAAGQEAVAANRAAAGGAAEALRLKQEINELCRRIGEDARYQLDAGRDAGMESP